MAVKRKKRVAKGSSPRLKKSRVIPKVMHSRYLWILKYMATIGVYTSKPVKDGWGDWCEGNRVWAMCIGDFEQYTGLTLPHNKPLRFRLMVEHD